MSAFTTSTIASPTAKKKEVSHIYHGVTLYDDYSWMRADNWQEIFHDPSKLPEDIRKHLEAENAYQEAMMSDTSSLRNQLYEEMKGRIKADDSTVPVKDGPFAYASAYKAGAEQPYFYRTNRDGSNKTVILDGEKEAAGKAYFRISSCDNSPDHKHIIWGYDDKGSEFFTLKIRSFSNGQDLTDIITNTSGYGVWDAGSTGIFYTKLDENHRPSQLYYHKIGTPQSDDILVHKEEDPGFFMNVSSSLLEDFIQIEIGDHETSEVWLIPADKPLEKPFCVAPRQQGVEYNLVSGGDKFYILTNKDGAKDFKIMTTPIHQPGMEHWQDLVAERPGTLILDFGVYENHLVWLERDKGLPRIIIHCRQTGAEHTIAFDEEAYSLGLYGSAEYHTNIIRFSYSSMTTPSQIFDYEMDKRERELLKTQEVPSGHNPDDYITKRLMAPAPDGELVPVSILYHRDNKLDGSAPCLLYGYGAYGISIPASFNTSCLSLVDRGFIYAIAHIRGGKDKGFSWYEHGKREFKTNTFTDFIAAAEYLHQNKYTNYKKIIAHGGSAGGMLMGAIANIAPNHFGGIIAQVPFVDVLNTMLDDTLPLTPPEWPEWGNPITSEKAFNIIKSYSPYDNVKAQDYPAIFALAGLTDPRVTYWEPAKWVAKLRELKTNDNPVLFKVDMTSGHAGASGRFARLEETALCYAFALKVANLTQ